MLATRLKLSRRWGMGFTSRVSVCTWCEPVDRNCGKRLKQRWPGHATAFPGHVGPPRAFQVNHNGTLFEGPAVASRIFRTMVTSAEEITKPIQLTPQQIAQCRTLPAETGALQQKGGIAYGTGFAITTNGTIVTAFHVVDNAAKIQVKFPGGD